MDFAAPSPACGGWREGSSGPGKLPFGFLLNSQNFERWAWRQFNLGLAFRPGFITFFAARAGLLAEGDPTPMTRAIRSRSYGRAFVILISTALAILIYVAWVIV